MGKNMETIVWGLRFRVWGSGFWVQSSGFRVQGLRFRERRNRNKIMKATI